MPSLTDLPPELLLSILGNTSRKDRLHASLTCKELHQVANSLFYAKISLDWSSPWETSPNSVPFLLRSLVERPQLGSPVKELHLSGRNFTRRLAWDTLTPLIFVDVLELDKVDSIIYGFQILHAQEWAEQVAQGNMDALVTLLLSFLPNVTRLRILSNFAKITRILALTLLSDIKASCNSSVVLPMLYSLESVSVSRHRHRSGDVKEDNTAEILLWFYLPNIRFLELSIDNPKTFAWPLDYAPCPSSLRSLTLTILREPHAERVFAVCTGLTRLNWTLEYKVEYLDISEPTFYLDGVTTALRPLQESLEDLTLTTAIEMGVSDIELPKVYIQGSLAIAHFPAMRKFSLSWPLAMGLEPNPERRLSDSIPQNVQEMTITTDGFDLTDSFGWDEFSMLGPMEEFFMSYKEHTPLLEQLNLVVECVYAKWSYRMRKEILYLCAGVGLKCSIIHHVPDGPPFETPPPGWVWRAPESWDAATQS